MKYGDYGGADEDPRRREGLRRLPSGSKAARKSTATNSTAAREEELCERRDEVEGIVSAVPVGGSVFIGEGSDVTVKSDPTAQISRLSEFNGRILWR